jgi:hypothetical protein
VFDLRPLPLRLASIVIPLLFGFMAFSLHRISLLEALVVAFSLSTLSILALLTVTGVHDHTPILPQVWVEWREVIEYGTSILLAFVCGNILSGLILSILPRILIQGGKPNALAFRMARMLGHVGDEQLRRRARMIQNVTQSAGPLFGVIVTSIGSLYTGLKGFLG